MFRIFKKPFYKNKTKKEFVEWFSKEQHWNKLSPKIIEAFIDKFNSDLPAFEAFVYVSGACKLVSNNYIPLSQESGNEDIEFLFSTYALTLYNTGAMLRDQFYKKMNQTQEYSKELSGMYEIAMYAFESAIKLNEYCITAFIQLAFLRAMLHKYEDALNYCQQGLDKIAELESKDKSNLTLIQSTTLDTIGEVNNSLQQSIIEYKKQLNS